MEQKRKIILPRHFHGNINNFNLENVEIKIIFIFPYSRIEKSMFISCVRDSADAELALS
jgi:polynucleotide 5'-kinase involved in rRNA processing